MRDIMVDIETFGTASNSVILSISAVEFDLTTGELGKTFEIGLNVKEQVAMGQVIDPDTVAWWIGQPTEAIMATAGMERKAVPLALHSFNDWLKGRYHNLKDVKLWGNGAGFDNVIVRNLYKAASIEFCLPFWCDNDVRTLVTLANIDTRNFLFEGVKHYGIDDCKHQIKYCHAAYKAL